MDKDTEKLVLGAILIAIIFILICFVFMTLNKKEEVPEQNTEAVSDNQQIENQQVNDEQEVAQQNLSCFDSDGNDIYNKGFVRYIDHGQEVTIYDECNGASTGVTEKYCYESSAGNGDMVMGAMYYACDNGCLSGACRQSDNRTTFPYPYPVSWQEDGVEFSLTSAYIGQVFDRYNETKGIFYGLALYFKVKTFDYSSSCPELKLRRLTNEEGDLVLPVTKQYRFEPTGGCGVYKNSTYYDQKVVFEGLKGEKIFTITTGGYSDVFFEVRLLSNGKVSVTKL